MASYNITSNTATNWTSNPENAWLFDQKPHQGNERSVLEIVIKAVSLTATITIATLYLARLRKQPKHLASYQTIMTLVVPTFPLADLIISAYRTLKSSKSAEKRSWNSYTICSALDIRASNEVGGETVPLHLVPSTEVKPVVRSHDAKWFAGLVIQSIFLLQMLYTIILWARRAMLGTRAFVDDFMALEALGGLTVIVSSLLITVMNTEWTCPARYPAIFHQRFQEASPIDFLIAPEIYLEIRMSCFIAAIIQSVAILSLKTTFAREFYHEWQMGCVQNPSTIQSGQWTSVIIKILSVLFNIQL